MHAESELYRILYIPVLVCVYCWLHKACFPKYIFQVPWSYNQTVFHNVCELRNCKEITTNRIKVSYSITGRLSDPMREDLCKEMQAANGENQSRQEINGFLDFHFTKSNNSCHKVLDKFLFWHATEKDFFMQVFS